jgi:sulfotransferase family protein
MRIRALARLGRRDRRPPAPFIVGVSRSGTTLLRLMLDAHPQLAIPPETHFIPELVESCERGAGPEEVLELLTRHRRWRDFRLDPDELLRRLRALEPFRPGDALRTFYGYYADRAGKPRWGDKTPHYTRKMPLIERVLPEARFVHLIRDGRDVALSLMEVHFGPEDVRGAAERWTSWIAKARRHAERVDHYLELRYEDLVLDPEAVLGQVCDFVELPWDSAMLEYHERAPGRIEEIARDFDRPQGGPAIPADVRARQHRHVSQPPREDRVARWRRDMSPPDQAAFEAVAGELLAQLGYPVGQATVGSR